MSAQGPDVQLAGAPESSDLSCHPHPDPPGPPLTRHLRCALLSGRRGSVLLAPRRTVTQRKAEDGEASGRRTREKEEPRPAGGQATADGDQKGGRRTGGGGGRV